MQTIHDRETTYGASDKKNVAQEDLVQTEKSLFRTRIPRPLTPTYHLMIAVIMLVLALFIAIFYAEFRGAPSATIRRFSSFPHRIGSSSP